jgi:hypothetical protein
VATYHVTLKNGSVEVVEGADAYQQEGQMTTFFVTGEQRQVVDCWSTRLASFRTSEVLIIRRVDYVFPAADSPTISAVPDAPGTGAPAGAIPDRGVDLRTAS